MVTYRDECQRRRFPDELFGTPPRKEPSSGNERAESHVCPFCEQPLRQCRSTIASLFFGGIERLFVAAWMIGGAILRCVRFIIAAVLCFVGFLGACFGALGCCIAHPEDRKLLIRF
jgi:hypothetical protein